MAVFSAGYFSSAYCLNESAAAVREHRRRRLPLLAARWSSAAREMSRWPHEAQAFVGAGDGSGTRMFLDLASCPTADDAVRLLCEDACRVVGVAYEGDPDPIGAMHLIKRTRQAISLFPVQDRSRIDGDVRRMTERLTFFHERSAAHRASRTPEAYKQMVGDLRSIRKYGEQRLNLRAMSYVRLAEAVFTMCSARSSRASAAPDLYGQARVAAERALATGDVYTQRDANVLLGNLALEANAPERALQCHLDASRVAHMLCEGGVEPSADHRAVISRATLIPDTVALCPRGVSAYVMFDNLLRCRLRLLQPIEPAELDYRAAEWRRGIAYSEPAHFARYGSLLIVAYAIAGRLGDAASLLKELERSDEGYNRVHFETWRVLCALLANGLVANGYAFDGAWVRALNWLSKSADERHPQNAHDIALMHVEGSRVLSLLGLPDDGLKALSRAVHLYPGSIRLRVERASMAIQAGRIGIAKEDCVAAIAFNATAAGSHAPFEESEGHHEAFYAQGLAFWFLGRKPEAQDRLHLSEAEEEADYSVVVPNGFAAAR